MLKTLVIEQATEVNVEFAHLHDLQHLAALCSFSKSSVLSIARLRNCTLPAALRQRCDHTPDATERSRRPKNLANRQKSIVPEAIYLFLTEALRPSRHGSLPVVLCIMLFLISHQFRRQKYSMNNLYWENKREITKFTCLYTEKCKKDGLHSCTIIIISGFIVNLSKIPRNHLLALKVS